MMKYRLILILIFINVLFGFAQVENTSTLSIKEIMKGEDFVGHLPENHRWTEDGKSILFSWNPDHDTLRSTYKIDVASTNISKLSFEELKTLPSNNGDYSKAFSKKVYEKNGDIFIIDLSNYKIMQITNTIDVESNPVFSGDGKNIIYRTGNNLLTWNIEYGFINQLTNFKPGNKKEDKNPSEMEQWLEQDQLAYFEILRERKKTKNSQKYRNKKLKPDRPQEVFLGEKQLLSMVISPDISCIIYQLMEKATGNGTIVQNYVTQSGFAADLNARSKVGSIQNTYETWIFNRKIDSAWQIKPDGIPGIFDKPEFLKDYVKHDTVWMDKYENSRKVIIHLPKFSDDGKAVLVVRSHDNKDRWIMQLFLEDGKLKLLDKQRDEAWIGGPGIVGWNFSSGSLGWLDNDNIWYQSEESGFSHLYRQNVESGKKENAYLREVRDK